MNDQAMTESRSSFTQGWWFFFEIDGHQVTVHGSAFSGRERVWVDDELVSDILSWKFATDHEIQVGDRRVTLRFSLESWAMGHARAVLMDADGSTIASADHRLIKSRESFWKTMAVSMAIGAVCGAGSVFIVEWLGR